jgi:hypothetical protein
MAQLKEDEWPKDGEPTTTEKEDAAFKREGPNPPGRKTGHSVDDTNRAASDSVMRNVKPGDPID